MYYNNCGHWLILVLNSKSRISFRIPKPFWADWNVLTGFFNQNRLFFVQNFTHCEKIQKSLKKSCTVNLYLAGTRLFRAVCIDCVIDLLNLTGFSIGHKISSQAFIFSNTESVLTLTSITWYSTSMHDASNDFWSSFRISPTLGFWSGSSRNVFS